MNIKKTLLFGVLTTLTASICIFFLSLSDFTRCNILHPFSDYSEVSWKYVDFHLPTCWTYEELSPDNLLVYAEYSSNQRTALSFYLEGDEDLEWSATEVAGQAYESAWISSPALNGDLITGDGVHYYRPLDFGVPLVISTGFDSLDVLIEREADIELIFSSIQLIETEPVEVPEFKAVSLTVNDVMSFDVPETWVLSEMSEQGPAWYDFEVYASVEDQEPDKVRMTIEWLDEEPSRTSSTGSFYSEDGRFVLYGHVDCESDECFHLYDLGTYYYDIQFNREVVGEASVLLSLYRGLSWLETIRASSGGAIDEVAEYLNVAEPVYDSEVVRHLMMLQGENFLKGRPDFEIIDAIDVLDEENFYIHLQPQWLDGEMSFTVFVKPDGDYLLAFEGKACGPLCNQSLYFYEVAPYGVNDVTDIYLPEIDLDAIATGLEDHNLLYELPRYGTTIKIYNQIGGEVMAELKWVNGGFVLIP